MEVLRLGYVGAFRPRPSYILLRGDYKLGFSELEYNSIIKTHILAASIGVGKL